MKKIIVVFGILANVIFFTYVSAEPPLPMVQTHTINIVVDCVDEAVYAIQGLGGHNISMNVMTIPVHGMEPIRNAEITRRVHASEYRRAQQLIRSLGTVAFESESARNVESQIVDLHLSINSANNEFERISAMMAASDNLQTLIVLDNRLSDISRNRDRLIGSLSALLAESGTALITINISEEMGMFVLPPEPLFGERIYASFFGSLRFLRATAEVFVVFVAYTFVPAVLLLVLAFVVYRLVKITGRFAWHKNFGDSTGETTDYVETENTEVRDV